ncbi:MAG: hypothetical protein UY15_C0033G0002 [Parcubacteria group bacterium GW2011_GWA2_47_9]|uniref:DUF4446 domain-containing protein n=1 Tax=Candidatus Wildermuthbacteria bacterium RIFCSPHIGHO2_02_FULL_47_17 TaxID=1802452 RepID=A0A1G2R6F7_9BACT|nr:MAG: hypothetical protein UY15_C0033G0002 [Parcubacteria group bacterium GW2011_GWA2_47_9]OHA67959.1 MAG: hypothetical protein A3D59_02930 [Candidatus Wildermuthbacteria bacterium RIFCSPHIGHO2_02_FULL_47_17]
MFIFKKETKIPENLGEILERFQRLDERIEKLSRKLDELELKGRKHIQKIGVVRFNPFKDVGGNQSFSVAILDEDDNGVVVTGLYSREGNRIYAKPIKNGNSSFQLSEEELRAIEESSGGNQKNKNNQAAK